MARASLVLLITGSLCRQSLAGRVRAEAARIDAGSSDGVRSDASAAAAGTSGGEFLPTGMFRPFRATGKAAVDRRPGTLHPHRPRFLPARFGAAFPLARPGAAVLPPFPKLPFMLPGLPAQGAGLPAAPGTGASDSLGRLAGVAAADGFLRHVAGGAAGAVGVVGAVLRGDISQCREHGQELYDKFREVGLRLAWTPIMGAGGAAVTREALRGLHGVIRNVRHVIYRCHIADLVLLVPELMLLQKALDRVLVWTAGNSQLVAQALDSVGGEGNVAGAFRSGDPLSVGSMLAAMGGAASDYVNAHTFMDGLLDTTTAAGFSGDCHTVRGGLASQLRTIRDALVGGSDGGAAMNAFGGVVGTLVDPLNRCNAVIKPFTTLGGLVSAHRWSVVSGQIFLDGHNVMGRMEALAASVNVHDWAQAGASVAHVALDAQHFATNLAMHIH